MWGHQNYVLLNFFKSSDQLFCSFTEPFWAIVSLQMISWMQFYFLRKLSLEFWKIHLLKLTVKQISRIADMAKFFWSRVAGQRMATLLKRRLHHGFAKSPYYLFFRTTADSCFPLKFFRQTENVGKVQRPETCR